ncbi:hypothetical protein D9M71_539940 [compost metagenome]
MTGVRITALTVSVDTHTTDSTVSFCSIGIGLRATTAMHAASAITPSMPGRNRSASATWAAWRETSAPGGSSSSSSSKRLTICTECDTAREVISIATTITSGSKLIPSSRQMPSAQIALTAPASSGRHTPRQVRSRRNSRTRVTAMAASTRCRVSGTWWLTQPYSIGSPTTRIFTLPSSTLAISPRTCSNTLP